MAAKKKPTKKVTRKATKHTTKKKATKKKTATHHIDTSASRIKSLEEIHTSRKKQRHIHDSVSYAVFIVLTILLIFFASFLNVFLLSFMHSYAIIVIMAFLGISYGWLYSHMLHTLRHTDNHHHVFAKVMLSLVAIISGYYTFSFVQTIRSFLELTTNNTFVFSMLVVFYASFLLPYVYHALVKRK